MIRGEGFAIGEFRFRRIYMRLGLIVRPRKKRKVRYIRGNVVVPVSRPNERRSIDFVHYRLMHGRQIRFMNVVDDFTRESLAMKVGFSFWSGDVVRTFEEITFERGLPTTIRFDNGSEFTSRKMLAWGAERSVLLHLIEPGRPTQNANVESFNGRARDEFLNTRIFTSIFDAHSAAEGVSRRLQRAPPAFIARLPYETYQPSHLSAA